jgi:hypothetical protein
MAVAAIAGAALGATRETAAKKKKKSTTSLQTLPIQRQRIPRMPLFCCVRLHGRTNSSSSSSHNNIKRESRDRLKSTLTLRNSIKQGLLLSPCWPAVVVATLTIAAATAAATS